MKIVEFANSRECFDEVAHNVHGIIITSTGFFKKNAIKYSKTCLKGSSKDKKWLLKTGDPLIQVHLHYILVQGTQKRWLLKTGDPLMAVTT